MIQPRTIVAVSDNTGARRVLCIRVLGRRVALLGQSLIGVVKASTPSITVKRAEIVRAVVVRRKKGKSRRDGTCIRFSGNAVVLINADGNPRGSRVFGPIVKELRSQNFSKIVSLSPEIV